jgi:OmpA-OmpF porin, OOP family
MKKLLFNIVILFTCINVSQAQLLKKVEQKAKEVIGKKADEKPKSGSAEPEAATNKAANNSLEEDADGSEIGFTRGNKLIFSDDFSKDAVGDFPANWNTSLGGEIKKLKGFEQKFLKIPAASVCNIELKKNLPENFTAEFDLIIPSDVEQRKTSFGFGVKPRVIDYLLAPANKEGIEFSFHTRDDKHDQNLKYGRQGENTNAGFGKIDYVAPLNTVIKIGIMVNKDRIRLFVDGDQKVDMPKGFDASFRRAFYFCASTSGDPKSKQNYFYISNVVLAETGKDERSAVLKDFMENGSFSTNEILFAVNSDKIQASSNKVLDEVANALKQASSIKVKIIGHTDSDGDATKNKSLSEKRAMAVMNALSTRGIAKSRMSTEGKGDTEPIAENNTDSGKAKNRRVEFVKQ